MDINLIQNIVFAILFAYFIIVSCRSLAILAMALTDKIINHINYKRNVKEYLKGADKDVN